MPSWTDRILWRVCSSSTYGSSSCGGGGTADDGSSSSRPDVSVVQSYYTSLPEVTSSDHKPVVAGFQLQLAPAAGAADVLLVVAGPSAGGIWDAGESPAAADAASAAQEVPVWQPHIRCTIM